MNNKIQNNLIIFICTLLVFIYSVYILGFAVNGDQLIYNSVYEDLKENSIFQGYFIYASQLSKTEIVYFVFIYLGSLLDFDKVIYMSFFNSLLFAFACKSLKKLGMPMLFCILIVGTNYYTQFLFFTGERLKFGMLLFFSAFIFCHGDKPRTIFILLSVLAHMQMLILWIVLSAQLFSVKLFSIFRTLKVKSSHLVSMIFLFVLTVIIAPQVIMKVSFYMNYYADNILAGIFKWAIFYFLTLISSKNKINVSIIYFTLLIPFLFVGGERLVMFCNILFYMQYKYKSKYFNFVSTTLVIYFFIKSIPHVSNIYLFGDGFA